jgi:hypothetical protein
MVIDIPGVTLETITGSIADVVAAGEYNYHNLPLQAGDIVTLSCLFSGSTDLDIYVYDPDLNEVMNTPTNQMATADNPETGTFTAAMTGTYIIEVEEFTGSTDGTYTFSITIIRPKSLVSTLPDTITFDTTYIGGMAVADGAHVMEISGYTDVGLVYYCEVPFILNNWLAPTIDIVDDAISIVNATQRSSPVIIEWSANDPNVNNAVLPIGDYSKTLLFHVYWRIVSRTDISAYVPGGVLSFVSTDWVLVADLSSSSFSWTISDTKKFPDGLYEFMVVADDGGDDLLYYDTVIISLGTGAKPVKPTSTVTTTVTVTVTVTETVTVTPTHGLEFIVLLAGIGGAFLVKKRRK